MSLPRSTQFLGVSMSRCVRASFDVYLFPVKLCQEVEKLHLLVRGCLENVKRCGWGRSRWGSWGTVQVGAKMSRFFFSPNPLFFLRSFVELRWSLRVFITFNVFTLPTLGLSGHVRPPGAGAPGAKTRKKGRRKKEKGKRKKDK